MTSAQGERSKSLDFGISLVAQLIGIAAVSSVFVSILANILIFRSVDLNFAAVASPSVLISGAVSALQSLVLLILLLLFILVGFNIEVSSDIKYSKWFFPIYLISGITAAGASFLLLIGWEYIAGLRGDLGLIVYLVAQIAAAVCFYFGAHCYLALKRRVTAALLVYVPLLSSVACVNFTTRMGQDDLVVRGESERCGGFEHVVWMSDLQMITTCAAPPYDGSARYFILPRGDLIVMTHRDGTHSVKHYAQTH